MRPEVAVVIPVYCERETLPGVIDQVFAQSLDAAVDVWIVDDSSPDGTAAAVEQLRARFDRLHLISRPRPTGRGAAVVDALQRLLAAPNPPDLIVEMDGDGSHEPGSLGAIVAAADDADVVIGSRYIPGGAADLSGRRRLLSRLANAYAGIVLGLRYNDCSTGYRCYRRSVLERVALERVRSGGHATHLELLFKLDQLGIRVAEVPIHYRVRAGGASKVTLAETLRVAAVLLRARFGGP